MYIVQPENVALRAQETVMEGMLSFVNFTSGKNMKKNEAYQTSFTEYPDIITVTQMGEMLDISTKSEYRLLKENKIEHFRIGRIYKIPKLHILAYLHVLS